MVVLFGADIDDMMITIGGTCILYGVPAMWRAWRAQRVNPAMGEPRRSLQNMTPIAGALQYTSSL